MNSAYAIETVNLTKEFTQPGIFFSLPSYPYKKNKINIAVNNINLQVKPGELFVLIGPNGAGKTTLIKLLSSLILPTKGTAIVAGYSILGEEEKVKASIGLVCSDERSFYGRLTGRQNLHFFSSLCNLSFIQAGNRINELSELLGIENLDKRFQEYSTGIKQRLSIARGLLNNPKILFMDEPTKSLDPIAARDLRKFIKDKLVNKQKITIFMASHNLEEVAFLADRLAIIEKGLISALGTIDELRRLINFPEATMEKIFDHFIPG